ncbi:MAG: hypothetical protein POELPBGB_00857 [Bacteroidia bacterium]|nr:hypothetical protein [Bacteroidia bacterium]
MEKNKKTGKAIIPLPPEKDFSYLKDLNLDPGQLYVLDKLARGYSYEEIGNSLGISDRGAAKRMEKLHKKTRLQITLQLYHYLLKLGILTLD